MQEIPKLTHSETVYDSRFLTLRKDFFARQDGHTFFREVVLHDEAAVIVPRLDDNRFILVRQFRHAINQVIYEFPAGMIDPNEDVLVAAKRELAEETGYRGRQWQTLNSVYPAPGFCNELLHFFLAEDLYLGDMHLDEDEVLEPVIFSGSELEAMIKSGEIMDAKTIMAYLYTQAYCGK